MTTSEPIRARRGGFIPDVFIMAGRALRSVKREPETVMPALIIPAFFYAINIGALQDFVEQGGDIDFKAFQLPVDSVCRNRPDKSRDASSGYTERLL